MRDSGEPARIQIVIADDHALIREGLRRLIESEPDLQVVGEAADGNGAVDAAATLMPDVLLLDVSLPDGDGVDALRRISAVAPQSRVLLVTAGISDVDLQEALRYGARGVVFKTAASELLLKAIRTVAAGEHWVSRQIVNQLARAVADLQDQQRSIRNGPVLTRREEEVLVLVAEGRSNKEIAARLDVSENTVKHHITKVFEKSRCQSRIELMRYAQELGIVRASKPSNR
jgi:DNA-binding NarL/FixJ family response regulator